MEDILLSSQTFIRALKSTEDPPPGTPSKIALAKAAWESSTLYIPRKATVILEWLFSVLLKARGFGDDALTDLSNWELLETILHAPGNTEIESIVSNIPFMNILSTFIPAAVNLPTTSREELLNRVVSVLTRIWPITLIRANIDILAECLWKVLPTCHLQYTSEGLNNLYRFILTGFLQTFDKASIAVKKKIFGIFSQKHYQVWLEALFHVTRCHTLYDDLFSIGISILYQPDVLRSALDVSNTMKALNNPVSLIYTNVDNPLYSRSLVLVSSDLLEEYLKTLRQHRNSIFPLSSSVSQLDEEVCRVSIVFIQEALGFLDGLLPEFEQIVWEAKLHLFEVTEMSIPNIGISSSFASMANEVIRDVILLLNRAWEDSRKEIISAAYDNLNCFFRIEPESVMPFMPQILERLAVTSAYVENSALALLAQLTEYQAKRRTLHDLVSAVISASMSAFSFLPPMEPEQIYKICKTSPLLSLEFSDKLTTTFRAFVTPTQANEIVQRVQAAMQKALQSHVDGNAISSSKDHQTAAVEFAEAMEVDNDSTPASIICRTNLIPKIAGIVLPRSLSRIEKSEDVFSTMKLIDTLVARCVEANLNASSLSLSKSKGKQSKESDINALWTKNCMVLSVLRFWNDLSERNITGNPEKSIFLEETTSKLCASKEKMMQLLRRSSLGDLQLEVVQALYTLSSLHPPQNGQWNELDAILDYVEERTFRIPHNEESETRHDVSGLLAWSLTLERYLPLIDAFASQEQLNRLVELITSSFKYVSSNLQTLSVDNIARRTFSCALFWELPNIRASMMSLLDRKTEKFASVDGVACVKSLVQQTKSPLGDDISPTDIDEAVILYQVLHYFPSEYLSRPSRTKLAIRAMTIDVLLPIVKEDFFSEDDAESQVILRSFLSTMTKEISVPFVDDMASNQEWIKYLTSYKYALKSTSTYTDTTLALVTCLQLSAISSAVKGNYDAFNGMLRYYIQLDMFRQDNSCDEGISKKALLALFELITKEKPSLFQASRCPLLKELCQKLCETLGDTVEGFLSGDVTVGQLSSCKNVLEAWQGLILLIHHLSDDIIIQNKYGLKLVKLVAKNRTPANGFGSQEEIRFKACVLSILAIEELSQGPSAIRHIGTVIAAYVLFTELSKITDYDGDMSRIVKLLSTTQYSAALDLVLESLQDQFNIKSRLGSFTHLSELLLRSAPEGTSRARHDFSSRCLKVFTNVQLCEQYSSQTLGEVMNFIQYLCVEQVGSLKALDVSFILLIIFKTLTGSIEHDERSSREIFQRITHILNVLVRLRRDLLTPILPQLGGVLRQLISVMRSIRAMLGAKQYRLVADTFPKWINPRDDALTESEAQSLARVLTALVTKSFIRSHKPLQQQQQKGESLARPFARHAPYVLLSYLQAMNDPLCRISVGVRRGLEPGLYALCDMMGEHGRDTLMAQSLDAGGKALFKALWKEYGKQKYVGKG